MAESMYEKTYFCREELYDVLQSHRKSFDLRDRYGDYGMGYGEAFKIVRMMPPADVRLVTFCKDCVMYRRDKELAEASYLDPNYYCGLLQTEMPEDGFCSYGQRSSSDAELEFFQHGRRKE